MICLNSMFSSIQDPVWLTIGTFDGLHRGHRVLLCDCISNARDKNIKSMVFSFSNLPKNFFIKNKKIKRLLSEENKRIFLDNFGIDYYVGSVFNEEILKMDALYFLDTIIKRFNVKGITVGFNFRFGYKNMGGLSLLKRIEKKRGISLSIIEGVKANGDVVSSSFIREHILMSNFKGASLLLGYYFFIYGKVIKGRGIGKKLGFPTANIRLYDEEKLIPKDGVYACYIILNKKQYKGVVNIGIIPSFFKDNNKKIEVHILDFNGDIYNKDIIVIPIRYISPELRLNKEALKDKIRNDIIRSREYFKGVKDVEIWDNIAMFFNTDSTVRCQKKAQSRTGC